MKCRDIVRCLSEYIDGDADALVRCAVAEHVAGCPRCGALLRTLEKTLFLSRGWYEEEKDPPPAVLRRVYYEFHVQYSVGTTVVKKGLNRKTKR